MKVRLGEHDLELLTRDDLAHVLSDVGGGGDATIRAGESAVTDATGAAVIEVYTCPVGKEFRLHRLLVDADGFTPGAPFKNGSGWLDVRRSGERVDFVNLENGLPALSIDGKDTAIRWRNGETVEVAVTGGPANTTIRVNLQGYLR